MLSIGIHVNTQPASLFSSRFADAMRIPGKTPGMREGLAEAANWYLGGMRRRFKSASAGDGTWPDLSPATKLARLRKGGLRYKREKGVSRLDRLRSVANVKMPILYDTGDLYTSLVPGEKGSYFEMLPDRIRAGSIDFKAQYHQEGGSRLPRRQILVMPDAEILARMQNAMRQAVYATSQSLIAGLTKAA